MLSGSLLTPIEVSNALFPFLVGFKRPESSVYKGLKDSTIFDRNTLFIIKEFMQPVANEDFFKASLFEYRILESKREEEYTKFTEEEQGLTKRQEALIRISMHGNIACLNFFLTKWPFPVDIDINKSGLVTAIKGATENRYIFIIDRLLQAVPVKQDKLIIVDNVLDVALRKKDFEIFKWIIFRYGKALKEQKEYKNIPQREETEEKPNVLQRIFLHTSSTYSQAKENPFATLYQTGKILEEKSLEDKEIKGENLQAADSNLFSEETSLPVRLSNQENKPLPAPTEAFSWSICLKIICGIVVTVGGAIILIFIHTPFGIAAGVGGCLVGFGLFGLSYKEKKKLEDDYERRLNNSQLRVE